MEKTNKREIKVDCRKCRWFIECDPLALAFAADEGCEGFEEAQKEK